MLRCNRKTFSKVVAILLAVMLFIVGCSNSSTNQDKKGDSNSDKVQSNSSELQKQDLNIIKNIMFVVTGNLGGGTNNDDVYAAIQEYTAAVGGQVSTFECNMDTSLYESTLMQAAETGEFDLIVTGFGTMIEPLSNAAAKYPNQKFFIFDTEMKYEDNKNQNVISVQVLQNQGGFMAGVLAAKVTTGTAPLANPEKKVGFVGAMESTAILDFLMGYIEGVKYVDPSIEVIYSFVGNHKDSALAKELGISQYQQGADVVFAVGGNGLGVAEAALEADKYVIGVDFDYAKRLESTSPQTSERVLTSVIKDYKGMVYPMLMGIKDGSVKWGTHSFISYSEGGVYLVRDKNTEAIVQSEIWEDFKKAEEGMKSGEIKISTAFGASTEEIDKVKNRAKPE